MSGLIVLGAAKGSPGVSTSALALAAAWTGAVRPVVWEADPGGGDALHRFAVREEPGLVSLAGNLGPDTLGEELIDAHTQMLPGGVPVVVGPTSGAAARAALNALAPHWGKAAPGRAPWLVELGRVDLELGYAQAPLRVADVVVLVTSGSLAALTHTAALADQLTADGPVPVLVAVVGPCRFGDADILEALPVAVCARLSHDVAGAAVLAGERPARTPWWRGAARFPLLEDGARLARTLLPYLPARPPQPPGPEPAAAAHQEQSSLSSYLARGGGR